MLAELELIPVGTSGTSLSGQLAAVAKLIDASGLAYRVGPMGTVVEGEWEAVMALARACHEAVLASSVRVVTTIRIDDRTDQPAPRMQRKVESLEKATGLSLRR